jgi:hypothetical protein
LYAISVFFPGLWLRVCRLIFQTQWTTMLV